MSISEKTAQSPWAKTISKWSASDQSTYWSLRDCGDTHGQAKDTIEGEILRRRLFR